MTSSDTELKIDEATREEACETMRDLLAQRAVLERHIAEADVLQRAGQLAIQSDDMVNAEIAGLCRYRGMRAFWSAALAKPAGDVEETLLNLSWDEVRRLVPNGQAYAEGMRALVAQLAVDRPSVVGTAIVNLVGADALLHLVELVSVKAYDSIDPTAGAGAANLHAGVEARH